MKKPLVSIIIPTRTITTVLTEENLPAFLKQTFLTFEVIVLPSDSSTKDAALKKSYPWLHILPTRPISRPAQKRDLGARAAKGAVLAFIDDDAFPREDWLEKAVTQMQQNNVEAICGPGILPDNSLLLEKVFDEVLKTWVGSGGLAYRFRPQNERFIDDYPSMNFLIKKSVFDKLGGFNSDYWPGEDSKLCEDLVYKLGGKILYHPDIVVFHHRRADLLGYLKQHGQYGFHRGAFFAHGDKNSRRLIYLAPTFFITYLLFLLISTNLNHPPAGGQPISTIIYLPLFLYLALTSTVFFSAFKNTQSLKIALLSSIVLFLMHVVYGVQFLKGFLVGLVKKDRIYGK